MANIEKLAAKALTLDLLINPDMLLTLPALVEHTPEMRIVINHIAGVRISEEPPDPGWVSAIQEVARYPNVYCKVSGLVEHTGQTPAPTDVAYYTATVDVLWDALVKIGSSTGATGRLGTFRAV